MKAVFAKAYRAVRRGFVPGVLGLAVILGIAHIVWTNSGSNEWRLQRDENGVQIYTLKEPGSTLLKVKAITHVKTSLSSAVFLLRGDPSTNDDFGGKDFTILERYETPSMYLAYYSVKHVMPPPFRTKELVILLNYAQDPVTRKVEINVQAAPTKIPPTANTSRVTHLNNIFRLTPLPDGQIEWEIDSDVDMGLLYPLANLTLPDYFFNDLIYIRKLVLTAKYQNAKLISVKEART